MTHSEAKEIILDSSVHLEYDTEAGTATIFGEVTIQELRALLQILEYEQ